MAKIAASKRIARSRHRERPDPLAARIGQRIRQLRSETAFAFDAFVEETGLGRGYVSELERGLVVPGVGTLARVARALGVTIADLVSGDSERERLFDELRGRPASVIRALRNEAAARARATEGDR
jgi:transcriptional regulator with XRE-family HTH domain